MSLLELSKENIQPFKSGRRAQALESALAAAAASDNNNPNETKRNLQQQQSEHEQAILHYHGTDPLLPWLEYIRFVMSSSLTPSANHSSPLLLLLEKCSRQFKDCAQYRQDTRMLRVWLLYADQCSQPSDVYRFMSQNAIGTQHSQFWIQYAHFVQHRFVRPIHSNNKSNNSNTAATTDSPSMSQQDHNAILHQLQEALRVITRGQQQQAQPSSVLRQHAERLQRLISRQSERQSADAALSAALGIEDDFNTDTACVGATVVHQRAALSRLAVPDDENASAATVQQPQQQTYRQSLPTVVAPSLSLMQQSKVATAALATNESFAIFSDESLNESQITHNNTAATATAPSTAWTQLPRELEHDKENRRGVSKWSEPLQTSASTTVPSYDTSALVASGIEIESDIAVFEDAECVNAPTTRQTVATVPGLRAMDAAAARSSLAVKASQLAADPMRNIDKPATNHHTRVVNDVASLSLAPLTVSQAVVVQSPTVRTVSTAVASASLSVAQSQPQSLKPSTQSIAPTATNTNTAAPAATASTKPLTAMQKLAAMKAARAACKK